MFELKILAETEWYMSFDVKTILFTEYGSTFDVMVWFFASGISRN